MFENNNNEKPSDLSLYEVYFIKLSLHMLLLRVCDHGSTAHSKRTPVTLYVDSSMIHARWVLSASALFVLCAKGPNPLFFSFFLREARMLFSNIHLEERRQHSSGSLLTIYYFFLN